MDEYNNMKKEKEEEKRARKVAIIFVIFLLGMVITAVIIGNRISNENGAAWYTALGVVLWLIVYVANFSSVGLIILLIGFLTEDAKDSNKKLDKNDFSFIIGISCSVAAFLMLINALYFHFF